MRLFLSDNSNGGAVLVGAMPPEQCGAARLKIPTTCTKIWRSVQACPRRSRSMLPRTTALRTSACRMALPTAPTAWRRKSTPTALSYGSRLWTPTLVERLAMPAPFGQAIAALDAGKWVACRLPLGPLPVGVGHMLGRLIQVWQEWPSYIYTAIQVFLEARQEASTPINIMNMFKLDKLKATFFYLAADARAADLRTRGCQYM